MAERLYKPAHGVCTHSHRSILDAILCAWNQFCELDVVAVENGRVERLNGSEKGTLSILSKEYERTERELFNARWKKVLDRYTDKEIDIFYAQWKQSGTFDASRSPLPLTTPCKNEYKCPDGSKDCGENAVYCEPCTRRFEEFTLLIEGRIAFWKPTRRQKVKRLVYVFECYVRSLPTKLRNKLYPPTYGHLRK